MSGIDMIVCIACKGAIHISSMLAGCAAAILVQPDRRVYTREYQFLRMYNQFKKIDCLLSTKESKRDDQTGRKRVTITFSC